MSKWEDFLKNFVVPIHDKLYSAPEPAPKICYCGHSKDEHLWKAAHPLDVPCRHEGCTCKTYDDLEV